ncbi:hypothetical protein [Aestuariivirga sp.]|jgi:hypothetical protein|uniref:hypothetical protein n=1 Tax=Aestuariivirga sp. TaxID=2650926 RepID=UPI003783B781
MILSHTHRFIAFKTRKTAGTSFEIALSKHMLAQDIVTPIAPADENIRKTLGYTGPQNYGPAEAPGVSQARFYNHISAEDLRSRVDADLFEAYKKVAIVRNPFDYVVSWYFWECRAVKEPTPEHFRQWLRFQFAHRTGIEADYRNGRRPNPGVFSSNRLITHINGRCAMDMLLRYEDLEGDIVRFAGQAGLPPSLASDFSTIRAKGQYRPKSASAMVMFDGFAEGHDLIARSFSEDMERFDYRLT